MVMTEWYEMRGGVIEADVIRWREPIWQGRGPKGKRRREGGGFGGQKLVRVGNRVVSAEVISGPDEDGWLYLLVRQYDNLGYAHPEKLMNPPKVGSTIKRKYKTIMNGDPRRLLWSDENARALLASQYLGNKEHLARFMAMDDEEDEG